MLAASTHRSRRGEHRADDICASCVCACFTPGLLSAGDGSRLEYSGHAQVAYEHGALRALAQLGQRGQQVADAALSGLHSAILMPLLAGMVAAFGMSPMSLPQEDLSHMLRLFSAVYEGRLH